MTFIQDPGLWLAKFSIELSSASANLYGNARQQAELRLNVQVQPGQPPLTPAQEDSLLLVYERPDGGYEQLPFSGAGLASWWQSPVRDSRYDLMPGSTDTVRQTPTDTSVFSKLLYVSTSQPGGSTVKLRAMIRKDASTTYYTDQAAGFDHYVALTTVRPPILEESDYVWQRTLDEGNVNDVFVHEYSLRLRNLGLSTDSRMVTAGMIRWQSNESQETWATYVGMAPPGSKTVRYNEAIDTGNAFIPRKTAETPGSDSLILVLNGANNIPFNREGLNHGGPCVMEVVDRHGNDHTVFFHFADDGTALERRTIIRVSYPTLSEHVEETGLCTAGNESGGNPPH